MSSLQEFTTRTLLLLLCSFSLPLSAAPLETVTNITDSANGSFRQALADVDDGGTINFDPSLDGATITLLEIINLNGEDTYGPDPISKSVTIDASALPHGITLDGTGNVRFIEVIGAHDLVCKNITFRNGQGTTPETPDPTRNTRGGAIVLRDGGSITLENCQFFDCNTTAGGGAVFVQSADATVTNCTFARNSATNDGGAFHHNGGGFLHMTNCTFDDNSAGANGGAINSLASSGSFVEHCTFADNTAPTGGAIRSGLFTIDARGSLFSGNSPSTGVNFARALNVADAMLHLLADNGGRTLTRRLMKG